MSKRDTHKPWGKMCRYLSDGGHCTKNGLDKKTNQVARTRVFHDGEWAGKNGRMMPLSEADGKSLDELMKRDNIPSSP